MLFEKLSQYKEAKQTLLNNDRDIRKSASILKKSPSFNNLSEGEIVSGLAELNEGLGDRIANFVSGAFGGDVSKIKTVLTQMKEQELKFNREEYEIYEEFYRTIQDQKALERDKKNPNYQELKKDLDSARSSLNVRMKELNKSHYQIFNALEEKIKDLTKDSNRKKKYFNAQRASDVLETQNDRYDKIKAITAKSSGRTKELEDFFNLDIKDLEKERKEAEDKAKKEERNLQSENLPERGGNTQSKTPEELLNYYKNEFKKIIDEKGTKDQKLAALIDLENQIFKLIRDNKDSETSENPFGDLGEGTKEKLVDLSKEIRDQKDLISASKTPSTSTTNPGTVGATGATGSTRRRKITK